MTNREVEDFAIDYVLQLERAAGREPRDARKKQAPVDVISPPRLIEVKAVGGSARGQPIPLEQHQVNALQANPGSFFLYVVENVTLALAGVAQPQVLVLDGPAVQAMVDRTQPTTTYWPTLGIGEYDKVPRLGMPSRKAHGRDRYECAGWLYSHGSGRATLSEADPRRLARLAPKWPPTG